MANEYTKLSYVANIEGNAAAMIIEKIADFRKTKNVTIGQSRATQLLLCELWNLKQTGVEIKPCE